jgi:hypothetical protein
MSAHSVQIENTSIRDQTICRDTSGCIMWIKTKMIRSCEMFLHRDRKVGTEEGEDGSGRRDISWPNLTKLVYICFRVYGCCLRSTGSDATPSSLLFHFTFFSGGNETVFIYLYFRVPSAGFAPFYGIGVLTFAGRHEDWHWSAWIRGGLHKVPAGLAWFGTGRMGILTKES